MQFPNQSRIALCQFLFLAQGNNKPISLVHLIERGLFFLVQFGSSHLHTHISHFVGCHNSTSHVQGLMHHDSTRPQMLCIRLESIRHRCAHLVAHLSYHGRQLVEHTPSSTCHSRCKHVSQMVERVLLLIAQQGNLLGRIGIACGHIQLGQVFGTRSLACIARHLLFQARHVELFVVAQGHRPTAVQAQHFLSLRREHGTYKHTTC